MFQGRRDFAFDISQAEAGYALLKGPKRLYVGDFGHSPSTFPGPDFAQVMGLGKAWFSRYLGTATTTIAPITLAPSPWRGKVRTFAKLPATRRLSISLPGNDHLAGAGRAVRIGGRFSGKAETFGPASVQVTARLTGGWSRLVAVLAAEPRKGSEIVLSEGGVNTTGLTGKRKLTISLIDTATLIPRGARLTLTLASSSVAQNPGNLLYLNLPMPKAAHIALGPAKPEPADPAQADLALRLGWPGTEKPGVVGVNYPGARDVSLHVTQGTNEKEGANEEVNPPGTVAGACFLGLAFAAPAFSAYSPSLIMEQSSYKLGAATTADVFIAIDPNADPTAKLTIFSPVGYSANLTAGARHEDRHRGRAREGQGGRETRC